MMAQIIIAAILEFNNFNGTNLKTLIVREVKMTRKVATALIDAPYKLYLGIKMILSVKFIAAPAKYAHRTALCLCTTIKVLISGAHKK